MTLTYHFWYIVCMDDNETPEIILTVVFYRNENGTEPVRDWLRSLEKEDKKSIGEDIKTVQYGWPIGRACGKKIGKRTMGSTNTHARKYRQGPFHRSR